MDLRSHVVELLKRVLSSWPTYVRSKAVVLLTLGVIALTSVGAIIPGIVANVLAIPYVSPAYLQVPEQTLRYILKQNCIK